MTIEAARSKSKTICEYCSAAGDLLMIGGVYSTLCEEHARARSDVLSREVFFIEDDGKTVPFPLYLTRAPRLNDEN